MEFITLSNMTGRPEYAASSEAIINKLHQKLPDTVRTMLMPPEMLREPSQLRHVTYNACLLGCTNSEASVDCADWT